jgi:hypothetical protein
MRCFLHYFVRAGRHKHEEHVKQLGFSCVQSVLLVCSLYIFYIMLDLLSIQNFTGTFPRAITLITNLWSVMCFT